MKTTQLLTVLTTSAIIIAGSVAHAQPGRGPGGDRGSRGGQVLMTLRAADANGDNSITRAEMETLQSEMFAWMDRTGDGFLDEADQSPVRQRLRALREARMAEEGRDRPRRRPRGGRGGPGGELHRADTNDDRRVSEAEFMAEAMRGFERLDADDDNVVTPDELDAVVERRQNRGLWWRD